MEHYAGIDVSLEESSVCVVDATGRIVREVRIASEPPCSSVRAGKPATGWTTSEEPTQSIRSAPTASSPARVIAASESLSPHRTTTGLAWPEPSAHSATPRPSNSSPPSTTPTAGPTPRPDAAARPRRHDAGTSSGGGDRSPPARDAGKEALKGRLPEPAAGVGGGGDAVGDQVVRMAVHAVWIEGQHNLRVGGLDHFQNLAFHRRQVGVEKTDRQFATGMAFHTGF